LLVKTFRVFVNQKVPDMGVTLVMRQSDREIMILAAVASLLAVVAEVAIAF